MQVIECARCGRTLKSPKAREVGYGAVCWGKVLAEQTAAEQKAQANIEIWTSILNGYAGARGENGEIKVVRIRNGRQEPLRHLVLHSPSGFEWGYSGSGPTDLARSIIADVTGDDNPLAALYQDFKRAFVTR